MSTAVVVGTADHYARAVQLFRARIEELKLTYDSIDNLCGFPLHYTATLLCQKKAMSVYSFFTMARALALLPVFEHDETQLAELRRRPDWIEFRRKGSRYRPRVHAKGHALNVTFKLYPDLLRKAAVKGGFMRAEKIGKRRRRQIARHAAQARWRRANLNGAV